MKAALLLKLQGLPVWAGMHARIQSFRAQRGYELHGNWTHFSLYFGCAFPGAPFIVLGLQRRLHVAR